MFSDLKSSERGSNSERELDLAVHGSSAPIHSQQPKTSREFKVVKHAVKQAKRREFPFPVDKIIYLAERLEVTSLTEKKIKSVSLSAVDVKASSLSDVDKDFLSCRGCDRKRNERPRSPDFDFALDLSSVSSTGDASDDDFAKPYLQPPGGQKLERKTDRQRDCSYPLAEDCPCSVPNRRTADSINYYMNAIDNERDLLRYFRPCRTCSELYCICPDSESDCGQASGFYKENKAIETDDNVTGFARDCSTRSTMRSNSCHSGCCCPEVSDCYQEDCPCEFRARASSDVSERSDRILTYTSSLANAARSARVLARDLELILSTLNNATE